MTIKQPKAAAAPHPWSHSALLLKAQRYAEAMMGHAKDDWRFALWSSLTLELLLRAALARVSPVLLADSRNWNHIYFALDNTPRVARFVPRSVPAAEVASRLEMIVDNFTPELKTFCTKHLEVRNEELHTGSGAFDAAGTEWQATFYWTCDVLTKFLGTDLSYLFGDTEAKVAQALIKASRDQSAKVIKKTIAQKRQSWKKRKKGERETLAKQALVWATRHEGHRFSCPACSSPALLNGSPSGVPVRSIADEIVTEKQYVLPSQFECVACGLKIAGLSHLTAAGLGDGFTATTVFELSELYAAEPESEPDFNE